MKPSSSLQRRGRQTRVQTIIEADNEDRMVVANVFILLGLVCKGY